MFREALGITPVDYKPTTKGKDSQGNTVAAIQGNVVDGKQLDISQNKLNADYFKRSYDNAPAPFNPPELTSLTLANYPTNPSLYTPEDAAQMTAYRKVVEQQRDATLSVYDDLKIISGAEKDVHVGFRDLQIARARDAKGKTAADVRLGKALSALAPAYAALSKEMDRQIQHDLWLTGQRVQQVDADYDDRRVKLLANLQQQNQLSAGQNVKAMLPAALQTA